MAVLESKRVFCELCAEEISSESSDSFCCPGCRTVHRILSAQGELANFKSHPLFQEALRSGIVSNPHLLEEARNANPLFRSEECQRFCFDIDRMWCPSCADIICLFLHREKGIHQCVVDYATDLASVDFNPKCISKDKILEQVRRLGYAPKRIEDSISPSGTGDLPLRLGVAAFFSSNVMMFSYPIYASFFNADPEEYARLFVWISLLSSLPVLLYSAWPILRRFVYSLRFGILGMESLVVIGVGSAFGLSMHSFWTGSNHVYFDSMTVIITFVLLGKFLESKAKCSAKETILRLSRAVPKRGRKIFSDGREVFVPLKEIEKGDKLAALTGEKIVLDGRMIEGEGLVDESILTGEAVPVSKKTGDRLISGSVVCRGRVVYCADTVEQDTTLRHIIQMIEGNLQTKSDYSRAVDPIVRIFVPLVCFLAFGTGIAVVIQGGAYREGLLRAVSILLISCPCAIGIAAPIAEAQTLNQMAKLGAVVRRRRCLNDLARADAFVFDKTGTVTEGRFSVIGGLEDVSARDQRVLKGMTAHTVHPMSAAIFRALLCGRESLDAWEEVPGQGMRARVGEVWYYLGFRERLLDRLDEGPEDGITSTIPFMCEDRLIAWITLGDKVRDEAPEVRKDLLPAWTALLSGDEERCVRTVAARCGFDSWKSGASPLEKKEFIDRLKAQGKIVCMMGDGINDAPALSAAHVGISVMTATDLSAQASDLMLTKEGLRVIPQLRKLAMFGDRVLRQNLFWAFFYNVVGAGLAMFGSMNPLIASGAMVVSSLIVVMNAQRISKKC